MNTADIADALVASDDKLTKTQAKSLVDGVFKAIAEAAAKGEDVSILGFGKFKVQDKPARTGRNPATGQAIAIAATKKVTFTPAKPLKDTVKG